jgi:hypothetical protein
MSKLTSLTAETVLAFLLLNIPDSTGNSLPRCSTWSSGSAPCVSLGLHYALPPFVREVLGAFFLTNAGSCEKWHVE